MKGAHSYLPVPFRLLMWLISNIISSASKYITSGRRLEPFHHKTGKSKLCLYISCCTTSNTASWLLLMATELHIQSHSVSCSMHIVSSSWIFYGDFYQVIWFYLFSCWCSIWHVNHGVTFVVMTRPRHRVIRIHYYSLINEDHLN